MLHTVSHSLFHLDIEALLRHLGPNDCVLLFQDGVTSAVAGSQHFSVLMSSGVPVYALQEDVIARGLLTMVADDIKLVDYKGFVALTVAYPQQMAW